MNNLRWIDQFFAGHTHTQRQQVVRVDRESPELPDAEVRRRLAALAVLLDLLQFKTQDKSPLALERQTDYRRTIARLDPPRAANDQRVAARSLRRDQSFQNAVVNEFLPAFAPQAAKAAALARAAPNQAGVGALWTTLEAALGAALLFPLVVLLKRRR